MIKRAQMLFVDFPTTGEITKSVKEKNKKRIFTGGVRINKVLFSINPSMNLSLLLLRKSVVKVNVEKKL